jgi:tetratricopeptide (TPR) repeat protein
MNKYKKAIKSFASAAKITKLDKSSEFNLTISEGILAYLSKFQAKSLKSFKTAKSLFPKNPMPELLRACILMHQSFKSEEYLHMLIKAELMVDNLSKTREPESEIMFCRSILKLCLKNFEVAYESIKKAIEKADENIPKHYIHRAFCNALLKKYEDAVQDFSIALQLNSDLPAVYIFRGISAYLQDDLQQAFDDFTTLAKIRPSDMNLLVKVANLLSMVGSYQDSLTILDSFSGKSGEVDYSRARNYLYQFQIDQSLETLIKIEGFKPKNLSVDKEILSIILDLKTQPEKVFELSHISTKLRDSEGLIFTKKYLFWFIGVVLYFNQDFSGASSYFQAVLEMLHSEEPEIFADSITIEEENCEILYNLALCSFSSSSPEFNSQALLIFEELAEVLNTKHKGQLLLLSAISEIRQKNKQKAEKLLKEALKCDGETVGPFLKNLPTKVLPLHTQSDLASVFPLFKMQVDDLPEIFLRPSIVLPRVCLDVKIEEVIEVVSGFFKVDLLTPRAEAPWLIRNKGSIQFTENLIEVPSDLLETEKSVEEEKASRKASQSRSKFLRKFKSQSIMREKSLILERSDETLDKEDLELNIKFICND